MKNILGEQASPNPDYPQEITNVTGDVEVKVQNKNWFDEENATVLYSNARTTIQSITNGIRVTAGQTSSSAFVTTKICNVSDLIDNKITVKAYWQGTNNGRIEVGYCDANGLNRVTLVPINISGNSISVTVPEGIQDKVIIVWFYARGNANGYVDYTNIQLEYGSTATDYVEHQEQTFTFPLGNEKLMLGDYLADDGMHHVRGQVDLSTLTWASLGSNLYRSTAIDNIKIPEATSTVPNILAEKYKARMQAGNFLNGEIAIMGAGNFAGDLLVCDETGTPSGLIQYELEEEVIVPYTSEQQRVYNEIKNAYSYDEMTIITGSSDGNKPFFIVQTYKDLNKELNNKVDKVQGKELSSNDFTDTLKEKLEGLENYDDTEIKSDIEKLQEENARLKATLPTTGEVTGQTITLNKTAEMEFIKSPLPMGNSEQFSTTGRNLWINEIEDGETSNGITVTKNADGSLTFNGTATAFTEFYFVKSNATGKYLEENQPYTITGVKNNNTALSSACIIGGVGNSTTNDVSTFTLGSTREITKSNSLIRFVEGTVLNNYTIKPMIIEGSTATDYEPYTNGASPNPDYPQEITNVTGDVEVVIENKNIFDFDYILQYKDEFSKVGQYFMFLELDEKFKTQFTVTSILKGTNPNFIMGFSDTRFSAGNNQYRSINGSTINSLKTFDFTNAEHVYVFFGNGNKISSNHHEIGDIYNNFNVMVEKNLISSNNYAPHQDQTFTFPLGNEKLMLGDYLADDGIHHVKRQVVFDGSESWGNNGETSDYGQYLLLINDKKYGATNIISNKFITKQSLAENSIAGRSNSNYIAITVDKKIIPYSKDNFKTWLSTHNVTVEYELAEEVIVPYTSAQQEVYNQIKQALSYEEQTNISSNTIALFDVEAYQSTKLVLKEMATAIVALGGV